MTKRERPKFQVGDIIEEFYYGDPDEPDISYWLIVKISFYCFLTRGGKQEKYHMYTLKSLNSEYIWAATRPYVDFSYNFRRVA